jgi:hypothetical protein
MPDPHQDGVTYFAETGHTLRGMFLQYWKTYGGLAQFGYPITEEFFEPSGPGNAPLQVQYFERSRFEMHRDNSVTPNEVLLGLLGREFHAQDPPAAPLPAPAQYFPQTGHNLSGAFLDYWQTHGGLFVHGYPISEPAMETSADGKQYLTQWFERSRFELHPENAGTPYEVLLGQLGRQLAEKKGYPFGWYPAYGHAVDYSWVAGQYMAPDVNEVCETILYVQIQTYPRILAIPGTRIRPTTDLFRLVPRDFGYFDKTPLVVFGHLDEDPNKDTQGYTCGAPKYTVNRVQHDPAQ